MIDSIETSPARATSTVAVVVPAWNESEVISETVEALRDRLREIGRRGEVVVVDDASDDDTAALATAAGARVVRVEKRQIAAVRNAGAAATEGGLLVFVDADTTVPAGTLRSLVATVERGAAIAGPRVEMPGVRSFVSRIWTSTLLRLLGAAGVLPGCCLALRRETFEAAGGFDEQWFASEEVWFVRAVRALDRGPAVRIDAAVSTSPRKANAVGPLRLIWQTLSIGLAGPGRWRRRARLGFWYER